MSLNFRKEIEALDIYLEVIRICVAFRAIRLGEDFFTLIEKR